MFFRVRSTISVSGARALDEVRTSFVPSTQSSSVENNPLYDCVGWLFSQLEHDGCANGFLNASHSFNVFLISVFQFLDERKIQNT